MFGLSINSYTAALVLVQPIPTEQEKLERAKKMVQETPSLDLYKLTEMNLSDDSLVKFLKFFISEKICSNTIGNFEKAVKIIRGFSDPAVKDDLVRFCVEHEPGFTAAYFRDFKIEDAGKRYELAQRIVEKDPENALIFMLHFDLLAFYSQRLARICDPVNGYTRLRNNVLHYHPSLAGDGIFEITYPDPKIFASIKA